MATPKPKLAIVGMAQRFPGQVDSPDRFWDAMCGRVNLVTEIENDRWDTAILHSSRRAEPGKSYVFAAGQLDRIREFDAEFFGISPREASQMDPQQRILLELTWEALEDAAENPKSLAGSDCAVFVGIASNDYAWRRSDDMSSADAYFMTGSTASIASNRISYVFDLRGPSMSVDTACSSSLVALHQACHAIWNGEASKALVGGVNMLLHPFGFVGFSKASMLSPTGQCRAFDADGDGYVRSEGAALFYLKRLEDAERDGDRIHALIANIGVNSDGRTNGITMPSPEGQSALLRSVYDEAGIEVNDIDYIEAHGTGTPVGDPIETSAIGETLAKLRSHKHVLPIGSVKTNVGHMETASGMAGLLKAVLCLKHRAVPPNLHFRTPNPNIDFDGLNIRVVDEYMEFPESDKPLIIGVNSFGFGGTNSHVIVEEYKESRQRDLEIPEDIENPPLFLSAGSNEALIELAGKYADYLRSNSAWYYDIAYQLSHKSAHLSQNLAVTANSVSGVIRALRTFAAGEETPAIVTQTLIEPDAHLAFVFSGNGSQWLGMGRSLYEHDAFFAEKLHEVDQLLSDYMDSSVIDDLFAAEEDSRFHLTEVAQPALFAIQVGITLWLEKQGIKPRAVAGHSVGEVSAAWAAGALSLKQAARVIYERSAAQGLTRGTGRMAALGVGHKDAEQLIKDHGLQTQLEIAGVNSVRSVTLAGPLPALQTLEQLAENKGIFYRILDLDYAFHSRYMDPIQERLLMALESLRPSHTQIPMYSAVTGEKIDGHSLTAQYWWDNIRQPVQFGDAVSVMIKQGYHLFMDIGPHPIMRGYLNECLRSANVRGMVSPTLKRNSDEVQDLNRALMSVHLGGAYMDLTRQFPVPGIHMELPRYPWQHKEYWHQVTDEGYNLVGRRIEHPLLGYRSKPGLALWENHLDVDRLPYLADHRVGDGVVMPAAGYLEMALAASTICYGQRPHEVEDLEIRSPLLFEEDQLRTLSFELDESSGHFKIKSRLRLSTDSWTEHAWGRILPQQPNIQEHRITPEHQQQGELFDSRSHYQLAAYLGLEYGPAFQSLGNFWIQDHCGFAELRSPDSIDHLSHQLHPCYLDACFQSLVGLLKEQFSANDARAMIPVRIGRLRVAGPLDSADQAAWFTAEIVKRSPRSVLANFAIYNRAGVRLVEALDCRFRSVRLTPGKMSPALYQYISIDKANSNARRNSTSPTLKQLQSVAKDALNQDSEQHRRQRLYGEIMPLVDTMIACFAHETMNSFANQGLIDFDRLFDQAGIMPGQQYLASRLLQILQQEGWSSADANNPNLWQLSHEEEIPDSRSLWLTLIGDYPGIMPEVLSAGRAGKYLPEILRGNIDPQQLISPGKSSSLRDHLADSATSVKGLILSTLAVLENWISVQEHRHFRILHIGGGQARLCSEVATRLPENSDYLYVHADPDTCTAAEAALELYPQAEVLELDLESAESWDDLANRRGLFDLVLINSNLSRHSRPDLLLERLRVLMQDNALLLCLEQSPNRLADITQGLDDDWWHRSQSVENPLSLLFYSSQSKHLLSEAGFGSPMVIDDDPATASGAYLLMSTYSRAAQLQVAANSDNAEPRQHWLCVDLHSADSNQYADDSSQSSNGRFIDSLTQTSAVSITQLVFEPDSTALIPEGNIWRAGTKESLDWTQIATKITESGIDKLIFISDINTVPIDSLATGNHLLQSNLVLMQSCRALAQLESPPKVCLICIEKPVEAENPLAMINHSLNGFTRVLRNEYPNLECRYLSVDSREDKSTLANVIDEILDGDEQRELHFGPALRRCPQLQPLNDSDHNNPIWQGDIKLDFTDPGMLKNLNWVPTEPKIPQADEILVRPRASGLNFRDVMYAMGLLSDEAVESGFSGPTLGMEFSGEVLACGTDVVDFKVGDPVMGFAPACFSTCVVTKASAASRIPENWLFEEAATVPTTFFTAYYALKYLAQVEPEERVLIHGAAGGVGIAAVQLAHYLGAEVFVTAGTDEKRDFVGFMGADHILDSRSLSFADDILQLTNGEGIDVVLNSLAGEAINKNLKILRPFGRFLELGKRDFYENSRIGLRPFRNNISYYGIDADQLMVEKPALTSRLFGELMDIFREGALRPLPYRCFNATRVEEAFRYMQQARQIGKILITYDDLPEVRQSSGQQSKTLSLNPEATYLVTGGLSGFGLETAKWLASRGARHLTLISRSGKPSEASGKAFAELESMDVTIEARAVDITQYQILQTLFQQFGEQLPKLAGIVHAAAVFEDSLIQNMQNEQLQSVLDPKALGAWNLHLLSIPQALEFFVGYSSVTTFFGNPGQANYVAANRALEGLIEHRRSTGLPGLSVAWGAISDVGFLARNEDIQEALQARLGGAELTSCEALETLERLLIEDRSGCAVMDFNWGAMKRFLPIAESGQFRLMNWIAANQGSEDDQAEDIGLMIKGMDTEEALDKVCELLAREIGQILRIPADKLDFQNSVFDLGMDSLMGVELAMAVEKRFGVNMPAMALSEGPSIRRISERIVQKIKGVDLETESPSDDEQVKRLAALHNEDMSEHNLRQLGDRLRTEEPGSLM